MPKCKYKQLSIDLENYIEAQVRTERLPGVFKLAEILHVNHVTLRKAIRLLVEQKKLRIEPRNGTYVIKQKDARQKFQTIGILGFAYKGEEVERLFSDMNYRISNTGYRLLNIASNAELYDERPELILYQPVDGFVLFGAITRKIADMLVREKIPLIGTINSNFSELNQVGMDHVDAYTRAVRLLTGRGIHKIAYVGAKRPPDFENYLMDIQRVFHQELNEQYNPAYFRIYDHKQLHREVGERYHKVIVNDCLSHWQSDMPEAVITYHQVVPYFRQLVPNLTIVEFLPWEPHNSQADITFYEDNFQMLLRGVNRMLEMLNGDTSVLQIHIPFCMRDNHLYP